MHRLLLLLPLALAAPPSVLADDTTDLRDRALKALAKDAADLKKLRVHTLKAKGISKIGSEPAPASFELSAAWPSQVRFYWEFGAGATKSNITIAGTDDRAWRKIATMNAVDLSVEEVNDFRADAYAIWVSTLSTLNDAATKLSIAGRSKVGGDPVLGLKVARRSWPEITLYFDEKTALLRKMTYRSREAGVTLSKEMIYEGHKDFNGLMLPTKQTTNIQGREAFSWTEMEYGFPEQIEPKLFAKPK